MWAYIENNNNGVIWCKSTSAAAAAAATVVNTAAATSTTAATAGIVSALIGWGVDPLASAVQANGGAIYTGPFCFDKTVLTTSSNRA